MAIASINLARVTSNLQAFNLLATMRANQRDLFGVQTSLATGLRFLRPSDDPLRASEAVGLDGRIDRLDLVQNNLSRANSVLTEVDSSMRETLELLKEAQRLAVQVVGDSSSQAERAALAVVVDSLLEQAINVGNSHYLNTYIFGGHVTDVPFVSEHGGVFYRGDDNTMETMIDPDLSEDFFTSPGTEFFRAVSSEIQGWLDLDPALVSDTLISDLNGALGKGVELGRIQVQTAAESVQVDLRGAATIGDVIDKLNAELPGGVSAALDTTGIVLTRADGVGAVTIADVGGGHTAADLGIAGQFNAAARAAVDIDPRLTARTRLADLQRGAGVNLGAGLVVRNGQKSATIDFGADVETIEDVLNQFNQADMGVWARVSADGRTLEVLNRVSGTDLSIEENGGQAASALGIRSLHAGTEVSALNDGRGLDLATGVDDLRIVTRNGTTIDVDLDGVLTLQDVIDRINAAAGGAVTAALVTTGNGLQITDLTVGAQTLRAEGLNGSLAAERLGLDVTPTGNRLVGRDVNPVRVDSPFTALIELSNGMKQDDRSLMQQAGERLDRVVQAMQQVQGQMASRARVMADRAERVETEVAATQTMLSDVRDVDFADAVVRFQQLQMALQANLSTASRILNLSVLDFLS